jgi:hypothetical protein
MTNINLGTLRTVPIRDVWKDEARDFTPWLLDNSEELSKAIGLELDLHESEYSVGKFSLDLIGVIDGTSERVIIENQLDESDHKHFGQLMTYAGGTDAKYVIWIASRFRDEYLAAIRWLNDGTTEEINFFAVEVSAVKIGESAAAPLFKVVAEPNNWTKETKSNSTNSGSSGRGLKQLAFWDEFIERVNVAQPDWTSRRKSLPQTWMSMSAKVPYVSYGVAFTGTETKSEITFWSKDVDVNSRRFDAMKSHKSEIESAYGAALNWHFPEGNKYSIVRDVKPFDFMDETCWPAAIDWLIDSQKRLRLAVEPFLEEIRAID